MKLYHYYHMLVIAFVAVSSAQDICDTDTTPTNIFWTGNSYTYNNGLSGLVEGILEEVNSNECYDLKVETWGGRQWNHWNGWALDSKLDDRDVWHYYIMQEQSQVPGFYDVSDLYTRSLDAVRRQNNQLHDYNIEQGGPTPQTILYMTWGRRDGDRSNSGLYPDYQTMQDRITEGYERYIDATIASNRPAKMAPVGLAFQMIYDDAKLEVGDPSENNGNMFHKLYSGDGSHPSHLGSYLAALIIASTITPFDPTQVTYGRDRFSDEDTDYIQSVAKVVVENYHGTIGPQLQVQPVEFVDVEVRIMFDRYSNENGWFFTEVDTSKIIGDPCDARNCNIDRYPNGKPYEKNDFMWFEFGERAFEWVRPLRTDTEYTFTITDSEGDGIGGNYQNPDKEPAGYTVTRLDTGEILAEGGIFTYEDVTNIFISSL